MLLEVEKHFYKSLISHKCKICIYEKSAIYNNVFPLRISVITILAGMLNKDATLSDSFLNMKP